MQQTRGTPLGARAPASSLHLLDFKRLEDWNSAKVSYRDEAAWLTLKGPTRTPSNQRITA